MSETPKFYMLSTYIANRRVYAVSLEVDHLSESAVNASCVLASARLYVVHVSIILSETAV